MPYKFLVFDLDGTLCDPWQGFVNAMDYALTRHHYPSLDREQARQLIGPPLEYSFRLLTGSSDRQQISALLASYREYYAETGYLENTLYEGIAGLLAELVARDTTLAVCTSKRTDFAEAILRRFELLDFFSFVCGGDSGLEKWQELAELVTSGRVPAEAIMIGDRSYDLVAARHSSLHSAGVLWGYGSREELLAHQPTFVFDNPGQILGLLAQA